MKSSRKGIELVSKIYVDITKRAENHEAIPLWAQHRYSQQHSQQPEWVQNEKIHQKQEHLGKIPSWARHQNQDRNISAIIHPKPTWMETEGSLEGSAPHDGSS
jgi:hypothetical protein